MSSTCQTLFVTVILSFAGAWPEAARARVNDPSQARGVAAASEVDQEKSARSRSPELRARDSFDEPRDGGETSAQLYKDGARHALAGRHAEAIDAFKRVISLNRSDADAHFSLGNVYADLGRWGEAAEAYRQAVRANGRDGQAHNNLGVAYMNLGSDEQATEAFRKAVRIHPNWAEPHYNLSNVYHRLGKSIAAEESFGEAVRLRPDYAGRGGYAGEQTPAGVLSQSANAARNTSAAAPRPGPKLGGEAPARVARKVLVDAKTHYKLGVKHGVSGRYAEAAESFRQAVSLEPKYADAHFGLGHAYYDLGRWDEAITAFEKVILIDPKDKEAYEMLGKAYAKLRARDKPAPRGAGVPALVEKNNGPAPSAPGAGDSVSS
ncbi:MAG: tetratricopeptide repeat protein, partial [Pyrinomonadaceae bacterium]